MNFRFELAIKWNNEEFNIWQCFQLRIESPKTDSEAVPCAKFAVLIVEDRAECWSSLGFVVTVTAIAAVGCCVRVRDCDCFPDAASVRQIVFCQTF